MALAGILLLATACGDDGRAAVPDGASMPDGADPDTLLSTWALFEGAPAAQVPAAGLIPFDVISPLYSDETLKLRFLRVPEGATIGYDPLGPWTWPVGSVLVKTFAYPSDARVADGPRTLLETRLLVFEASGWTPHVFVWNEAQTEAFRRVAGADIDATWIDAEGAARSLAYRVPNTNQCLQCHGPRGATAPIGPRTRQLDRDGQLEDLASRGLLVPAPEPAGERVRLADPRGDAGVVERARAYLDGNCAHCHNPTAAAQSTGLRLNLETTAPVDLGVCRSPFSAGPGTGGRAFDVVPGHPEQSILIFRVSSTEPELKMPEGPTRTSDAFGVELLTAWIAQMTPEGCGE